jgi:hypothetical protein
VREESHVITTAPSPILDPAATEAVLGIPRDVPLTIDAMARGMRLTFLPHGKKTPRITRFVEALHDVLVRSGVKIIPFSEALEPGAKKRVQEGVVIIAAGELEAGSLPVDYVGNLRRTTAVGIVDAPCPVTDRTPTQANLDSVVQALAWSIVQVIIFVQEDQWTICTMNGAIIPCRYGAAFTDAVRGTLISKIAAPVVPPHAADFLFEEGVLDVRSPEIAPHVRDFEESAPLWARTGVMLFHTSTSNLQFRNDFYRRIGTAYLDRRSGMSYGFLARQLAVRPPRALHGDEADALLGGAEWREKGVVEHDGKLYVALHVSEDPLLAEVPAVRVLATRSGCDKAHVQGDRDLMLMQLDRGNISFQTPPTSGIDYRPSYDTLTILAHALGNALIASVMALVEPDAPFLAALQTNGSALAHWHGTIDHALLPRGYRVFGAHNPPVSCSTHQSASFALEGKLAVLRDAGRALIAYAGDLHIEPHHGVNVTWPSLVDLAQVLLEANGNVRGARWDGVSRMNG